VLWLVRALEGYRSSKLMFPPSPPSLFLSDIHDRKCVSAAKKHDEIRSSEDRLLHGSEKGEGGFGLDD